MIFFNFWSEQRSNGLLPFLSSINRLAPEAIRNSTASKLFFIEAKWRAVQPYES